MARQRGGSAPRRPTAPTAKPATVPTQRSASTAAHPPQQAAAPPPPAQAAATPQGPGLFGQMASTAAGVAVGSSIGHAVGGWFSGGSSAPADAAPQNTEFAQAHQTNMTQMDQSAGPCATDVNSFRKCMDDNQGSLTICGWYLDQLKACQQAAGQY